MFNEHWLSINMSHEKGNKKLNVVPCIYCNEKQHKNERNIYELVDARKNCPNPIPKNNISQDFMRSTHLT